MKLRVVSLFSGCGGADLGLLGGFKFNGGIYRKHPIEIVHASDICRKATATYNANFVLPSVTADIFDLSFAEGEADLVVGGFPCQSFSTVNPTKNPLDNRGLLYNQMARVIKQIRPKFFIAENVKGFLVLGGGRYFKAAKETFEKIGYAVTHDVLSATDFGVPQRRQRVFMVGIRSDIKLSFSFPQPSHGVSPNQKPLAVLGDVIDSLVPPESKYYFSRRAVEGVKKAKPNMKRALAQDLKEPCLTISSHLAKVSLNSRDPVLLVDGKKELYRRFTPLEAARIQSFPDKFVFVGSEADAYRQIGNAIPPVLMWHLAKSILRCES